jgi:type I restriction enzyme, S subunit
VSWPSTRLADLSKVITKGTTPTTLGFDFCDEGVRFLRVQNIEGGSVNYQRDTLFIDERTHQALARSQIQQGDILISIAGTIGRPGVVPDSAPLLNCNQAIAIVRTNGSVFRPFLRHWLESSDAQTQMRGATVTGTISNLSLTQVGNLRIPVPPLVEQRRIAEVLDWAEALRARRRVALAQLDTLTQSIFLDLFGDPATNPKEWAKRPLSALVVEFRYGTSNKSEPHGQPALRIPNVVGGVIDISDLKLVPVDPAEFDRLRLIEGDVLFVRTNGNPDFVGRCAVFHDSVVSTSGFASCEFIFASYLIRVRLRVDQVAPIFLREFMLGPQGRRQLRSRSKTSAGQFNINVENLGAIDIPLPPRSLQDEFARRVATVEKLKAAHRASLAEMDALFAVLQHRAFRGELQ